MKSNATDPSAWTFTSFAAASRQPLPSAICGSLFDIRYSSFLIH
jgi:hypothetical protein